MTPVIMIACNLLPLSLRYGPLKHRRVTFPVTPVEKYSGDRCLNTNWFLPIDDAKEIINTWHKEYNEFRPHSSLGDLTPDEFREKHNLGLNFLQMPCPING